MPERIRRIHETTLTVELTHLEPGTCWIRLQGEMDNLIFHKIINFVRQSFFKDETAAVIDLSALEFMDSSGVKLLISLSHYLKADRIALCGINPNIRRIFKIAGLDGKFREISKPMDMTRWAEEPNKAA